MATVFLVKEPSYVLSIYWVRLLTCNMDSFKIIESHLGTERETWQCTPLLSQRSAYSMVWYMHIHVTLCKLLSMLNMLFAPPNTKPFLPMMRGTHIHVAHHLLLIRVNISLAWWALVPFSFHLMPFFLPQCGFGINYPCFKLVSNVVGLHKICHASIPTFKNCGF